MRLRKDFTGVFADLVVNCHMIRRAVAVATVLLAVCFPLAAEQPHRAVATRHRTVAPEQLRTAAAFNPALAFSLFQPNAFSSKDSFLLLHKGPVHAWSDGGQLASENALASSGMVALDLFSGAYLPPAEYFRARANKHSKGCFRLATPEFWNRPKGFP